MTRCYCKLPVGITDLESPLQLGAIECGRDAHGRYTIAHFARRRSWRLDPFFRVRLLELGLVSAPTAHENLKIPKKSLHFVWKTTKNVCRFGNGHNMAFFSRKTRMPVRGCQYFCVGFEIEPSRERKDPIRMLDCYFQLLHLLGEPRDDRLQHLLYRARFLRPRVHHRGDILLRHVQDEGGENKSKGFFSLRY